MARLYDADYKDADAVAAEASDFHRGASLRIGYLRGVQAERERWEADVKRLSDRVAGMVYVERK